MNLPAHASSSPFSLPQPQGAQKRSVKAKCIEFKSSFLPMDPFPKTSKLGKASRTGGQGQTFWALLSHTQRAALGPDALYLAAMQGRGR